MSSVVRQRAIGPGTAVGRGGHPGHADDPGSVANVPQPRLRGVIQGRAAQRPTTSKLNHDDVCPLHNGGTRESGS